MKSLYISAALLAVTPAFAADVDLLPYGYVTQVMHETKVQAAVSGQARGAATAAERAAGEAGAKSVPAPSAKSREQVIAETQEAARLGLLVQGEGHPAAASTQQDERIRQAGLHAIGLRKAAH